MGDVLDNIENLKSYADRGARAITAKLKAAIESGIYADNERLPPERELAESFGAARGTIRKALDELENIGLVVRRVGSGTFVKFKSDTEKNSQDVSEITSPLQLIEARFAIEPYMTRLACVHATNVDIEEIAEVLKRLENSEDRFLEYIQLDSEFHSLIARCSRNPLIIYLYHRVDEVRRHSQWLAMQRKVLSIENIREYDKQHRQIYEAIERRDVQAAVAHIKSHLENARQDLVGADSA